MPDATAATCAHVFVLGWIARFGIPQHISSDRGVQFTWQLWTMTSQLLGIQLHNTTAYHPQANGLVELFKNNIIYRNNNSSVRQRNVSHMYH